MKKLNNFFNSSVKNLKQSLEENLPEEHQHERLKMQVTMTHSSGQSLTSGICRCQDEDGNWKWMNCSDCPA